MVHEVVIEVFNRESRHTLEIKIDDIIYKIVISDNKKSGLRDKDNLIPRQKLKQVWSPKIIHISIWTNSVTRMIIIMTVYLVLPFVPCWSWHRIWTGPTVFRLPTDTYRKLHIYVDFSLVLEREREQINMFIICIYILDIYIYTYRHVYRGC